MLELTTLGELRLSGPAGDILAGRRKELALLACIACRAPQPVGRAELATLFWGDRTDARANHSLRQALLQLRRATSDALVVERTSVTLRPSVMAVDARAFETELEEDRLDAALARYAGDFLSGHDDVGGEEWRWWVESDRERLRRLLAQALASRVDLERTRGDSDAALRYAAAWAGLLPLDEAAVQAHIAALRSAGKVGNALTEHEAFTVRLARELELEPSPEFAALREGLEAGRAEALPAQRLAGSVALFTPPMIGRAPALAELRGAWAVTVAGGNATVVVEGESGVGKTLLCDRFLDEMRSSDTTVLVLTVTGAADRATPWTGLAQLLAPLAGAPGLGGVADETLAIVARLVPAIRTRYPRLPETDAGPEALTRAVVETLGVVAEEAAIAAVIDDSEQLDKASRGVVLALLQAEVPRVLVIVTVRAGLERVGMPRELSTVRERRHLKLAPLTVDEVDALVHAMLEMPASDRRLLSRRLHAESRGNPFYAIEMVFALVDEGHLAPDSRGIWRAAAGIEERALPLPRGIRETLRRRLHGLPPDAAELAGAAAVIGDPIDEMRLVAALGWDGGRIDAALEELLSRRLLRESPGATGRLEFIHPQLQRVAHAEVPPSRRRRLLGSRGPARRSRFAWLAATAVLITVAAIVARAWPSPSQGSEPPLLAIGWMSDLRGTDDDLAMPLGDMLATNLARVRGLQVVSSARMYELLGQLAQQGDPRTALTGAARQAGAVQLLEGSISRMADARLRLDLRRTDLATGSILQALSIEGTDVFELADRATLEVAQEMGLAMPALRVSDATTGSLVAYRFYEEGLRRFSDADYRGALHLFETALREDTAFALAAFNAWRTRNALGMPTDELALQRMLQLADRAPDRDRLLVRGSWAVQMNDLMLAAVADTLAIRYPGDPEGQYLIGISRFWAGDFAGARAALERVVTMDSLGLRGSRAECLACDALANLVDVNVHMDSLAAAERVAREWIRQQPLSARALEKLSALLLYGGEIDSAMAARRRAGELHPIDANDALFPAIAAIYAGRFADADRMLGDLGRTAVPEVRQEALWFLTISLRAQGRLNEALELVRARAHMDMARTDAGAREGARRHEAQILFELGRLDDAAQRLRDRLSTGVGYTAGPSFTARQQVMNLTQLATALAAAGDTLQLAALADSVEHWGALSAYGRDRRLHHHVRGLMARARSDLPAAGAEFSAALFSPTSGYTRTNLELARVLLEMGDARAAVAVLAPALHGPLESSNLFVTRTEVDYLLGTALDADGRTAAAVAAYRRVLAAWQNADRPLRARRDSIARRLAAIERS